MNSVRIFFTNSAKITSSSSYSAVPVWLITKGLRSYWRVAMIIITTGNLPFHFKPVKKGSYCKNQQFSFNEWRVFFVNNINEYGKHCQSKQMTPNKFQNFYEDIQNTLKFLSNLHVDQQFSLVNYRISQILLRVSKFICIFKPRKGEVNDNK